MRRLSLLALLLVALAPLPSASASPFAAIDGGAGKVFLTRDEALALAFPDAAVEKRTAWLTRSQRARARKLAGVEVKSGVVHAYVASRGDVVLGTAYFDVTKVRTKKQVVMFVVAPNARIERIELLSFAEPLEYIPRASWYAQFLGRGLDERLSLKREIKGVTGATLTARATTDAARRVLALHAVSAPAPPKAR